MSAEETVSAELWRDPANYPPNGKCWGCGTAVGPRGGMPRGPKSPWGYWCHAHNVARMEHLDEVFEAMKGRAPWEWA